MRQSSSVPLQVAVHANHARAWISHSGDHPGGTHAHGMYCQHELGLCCWTTVVDPGWDVPRLRLFWVVTVTVLRQYQLDDS